MFLDILQIALQDFSFTPEDVDQLIPDEIITAKVDRIMNNERRRTRGQVEINVLDGTRSEFAIANILRKNLRLLNVEIIVNDEAQTGQFFWDVGVLFNKTLYKLEIKNQRQEGQLVFKDDNSQLAGYWHGIDAVIGVAPRRDRRAVFCIVAPHIFSSRTDGYLPGYRQPLSDGSKGFMIPIDQIDQRWVRHL